MNSLSLQVVKRAGLGERGPVVFAVIRDEDYFLPHFFEHYRRLGIEAFVVYDDRSGPATADFLLAQPDCSVLRSERRFGDVFDRDGASPDRRLPLVLKESVPERLLPGRWVLTVDADEFLILPIGYVGVPQLIADLERLELPYLTAPMVDFYGPSLNARNYPRHLGPFEGNPYFDAGPYYKWEGEISPRPTFAGVRVRLLRKLLERSPDVVAATFGSYAVGPGLSWKSPLLKHGCGITRVGDHRLSVAPRDDITAALAHFKFYPDLDAKIDLALAEGQYFGGSVHYRVLKAAIDCFGDDSLIGEETRAYDGPGSLEAAQLMWAAKAWGPAPL